MAWISLIEPGNFDVIVAGRRGPDDEGLHTLEFFLTGFKQRRRDVSLTTPPTYGKLDQDLVTP